MKKDKKNDLYLENNCKIKKNQFLSFKLKKSIYLNLIYLKSIKLINQIKNSCHSYLVAVEKDQEKVSIINYKRMILKDKVSINMLII